MNRGQFFKTAGKGLATLAIATAISPTAIFAQQEISLENRIAQLQQRIEEKPRDANLHFELSQLYEEDIERYYDESLSEFKVAVDRGLKGKTIIWNDLGTSAVNKGVELFREGGYDDAIEKFEDASRWNPNYPLLHSSFATAYEGKGDYDEAIKYMKKAIDLDPSGAGFYGAIGMTYLKNEDFKLSILNLNRSMYLDDSSENKKGFFNIAQAYHGLKEYSNAVEALDQLPRNWRNNDTVKAFRKECVGLLNN